MGRRIRWESEGPTLYIEGVYPTWGSFELRPMYNVTYDKLYRGTTFQGGKYCDWMLRRASLITPLLARRTGRPVRCMNTRQDDFYTSNPQRYSHVKIGFKKDGTITAVQESTISDSGAPGKNARALNGSFGGGAFQSFQYHPVPQSEERVPGSLYQFREK